MAEEPVKPASSGLAAGFKSFVSGGIGGMSLVLAGHPLDLIKVKLQGAVSGKGQYTGVLDVARKTVAESGVRGLYRGISAPLIGVTPIFAINFAAYDLGKSLMSSWSGKEKSELSLTEFGVAGAFAAIPTTLVMAPGERIKCMMQLSKPGQFTGSGHVVRHLWAQGGISNLYRGAVATLLRDGMGSFAYFATYEGIKRALSKDSATLSPLAVIFGGGLAGATNWLVAVPMDTIKTRIQTQDLVDAGARRMGIVSTAKQVIREAGFAGLFKGLVPALARAFPANAACFLGMELSRAALDKVM